MASFLGDFLEIATLARIAAHAERVAF